MIPGYRLLSPDDLRRRVGPSSQQLTLDEVARNRLPRWRREGLETERLAALDCYARTGSQRFRVLFELFFAGERGHTDYELGETLRILRTSAGKRRKELMEAGLVEASGNRRRTDTGSSAVVWILTEKGREVAALLSGQSGGWPDGSHVRRLRRGVSQQVQLGPAPPAPPQRSRR